MASPAPPSRLPNASNPEAQRQPHDHVTRLPSALATKATTECGTTTDQAVEETIRVVMEQNKDGLSVAQQHQLWDIIYEHRAAFATALKTWVVPT